LFWRIGLMFGVLCTAVVRGDDGQTLEVGDRLPEFQCLDEYGLTWNSRTHVGKQLLVVYFYPSDFSFCCTRQAQRYRDRLRDFCFEGAEVVGVSGDAVSAHRQFQATHDLGFSLLSDADGQVARKFGVPLRAGGKAMIADEEGHTVVDAEGKAVSIARKVTTGRWTFVIDEQGRVLYRNTEVSPVKDSQEVLEFIRQYRANETTSRK
jgi:peroxiredoxin Q/BCP